MLQRNSTLSGADYVSINYGTTSQGLPQSSLGMLGNYVDVFTDNMGNLLSA
ncbi:MAG: hypothetical protein ACR2MX_04675 [Cyclobacteriaceae bacterium]